ncbi:MAG: stage III sporulation AC/AD family protein, partial [Clostridia bacterium]|nr:stage III sporulation AC/AD family protein [Clostridia bacterium]
YLLPVGKLLGVGYLGEVGEEVAKELGANGVSLAVSFFAKTELLLFSLPYAESLLGKAWEALA